MNGLVDILVRYSKATNITLPIENGSIDLESFFKEACGRGFVSLKLFTEICNLLDLE